MKDSQLTPECPRCDVTERQEKISRIRVYAKRERDDLERRAQQEGSVVKGGIIVPRRH